MGSEKRCIKVPAVAAKVAKPDDQPGQSSSSKPTRTFTPYQMAKAAQSSKTLRTPASDTNGTLKRVLIYRWKWDHEKTPAQIAQYGRDGCT
eukprot:11837721-Heterocapsa_arctica.AAC.1